MTMNVGLVYDLRRDYLAQGFTDEQVAEFDSEETIQALASALETLGCHVERIGNFRALAERLVAGRQWDLVFNIAEGVEGRSREAQVPALLEAYGVPCTFSDPLVCALTLDKAMTKRIVGAAGLPTPRFHLVETPSDVHDVELRYPLFAKPVAEGTGKGIDGRSRVGSPSELSAACERLLTGYGQPVLVEEYLPGREFTTAVLGTGSEARVLGSMEVRPAPGVTVADYSYEMKERCETLIQYVPMERGELRAEVEDLALRIYRLLGLRDAGRMDFRLDRRGKPFFLEVNPLPGLHPTHSDLPMIATQEGMTFVGLIGAIVNSSLARRTEARPADRRKEPIHA